MNPAEPSLFQTTRWTIVLGVASGDLHSKQAAMEHLCNAYWMPVYAWLRRKGNSEEDSQDLTQEFFLQLVAKDFLSSLRQEGGKFRTFLLTVVSRFATDQYHKSTTQKRGGHLQKLSLDWELGETFAQKLCDPGASPDAVFDHVWADTVVTRALVRLASEAQSSNKKILWPYLQPLLGELPGPGQFESIAAATGVTTNYVSVSLMRWRRKLKDLVMTEIRDTTLDEAAMFAEYDALVAALRRS